MCFCVSLDRFGIVFSNFVLLVYFFSVPSQEIDWEERLRNDHILCRVGRKTLLSSVHLFYGPILGGLAKY